MFLTLLLSVVTPILVFLFSLEDQAVCSNKIAGFQNRSCQAEGSYASVSNIVATGSCILALP